MKFSTPFEEFYCARGDMNCPGAERPWDGGARPQSRSQNRIKEQQLDMFADRTSTRYMASNQLRLWLSTSAYKLVSRMRTLT